MSVRVHVGKCSILHRQERTVLSHFLRFLSGKSTPSPKQEGRAEHNVLGHLSLLSAAGPGTPTSKNKKGQSCPVRYSLILAPKPEALEAIQGELL